MKKILVIVLVCVLTLSSFLFTACDERVDNNSKKPSEETTGQPQNNTVTEENPMPVPSVKGKNARQLFEDAISAYTSSTTFDVSMSMETTEDGKTTTEKIAYKFTDTEMYFDIELDEQDMTIWFVDNTVYLEMDDEKYKASNTSIADVLGEDFFDQLLAEFPTDISDIPEAYIKKMEGSQIYSYKGIYYFSVTVTDEEAVEMELGEKGYTETIYFDANGAIKKIVAKDAESTMTVLINSYGKDVTITKPENADTFVEQSFDSDNKLPSDTPSDSDHGNQDPQTYAVYEQLLDKIDNATSYIMGIDLDEEPYISYQIDSKGGKFVYVTESENSTYEMWIVDGQGYVSINGEKPLKCEITSDMLQSFDSVESLKDYLVKMKVLGDDMIGLSISNTTIPGEKLLTFSVKNSSSEDLYSFTFGNSYIDALITTTSNGQSETIKYIFDFVDMEVYAPI